jgi:hypothetical protein
MSGADGRRAAFYCVCDDRYFLGAVGMINSLRLQGHEEPIFVLDCGLTGAQRELLAPQATVVTARTEGPPWLLKAVAPLDHPAEVMILIDADMIVTRPLTELIEEAGGGRVIAFRASYDRFVPEWGELLELGPIRRRPYVSSGLVFLGAPLGTEVLGAIDDRRHRVEAVISGGSGRSSDDYAFFALDQDVLNAVLAARAESGRIVTLEHRLAPNLPFEGLKLKRGLSRCAYEDGTEPYVVHHLVTRPWPVLDRRGDKPWLASVPSSIYSRLLTRHLVGAGLAIEVPANEVPRSLRTGALARIVRAPIDSRERLGWYLRDHLPGPIVRRVDAARRRRRLEGL